eukprot:1356237-Rhodomonas_salina.1
MQVWKMRASPSDASDGGAACAARLTGQGSSVSYLPQQNPKTHTNTQTHIEQQRQVTSRSGASIPERRATLTLSCETHCSSCPSANTHTGSAIDASRQRKSVCIRTSALRSTVGSQEEAAGDRFGFACGAAMLMWHRTATSQASRETAGIDSSARAAWCAYPSGHPPSDLMTRRYLALGGCWSALTSAARARLRSCAGA